MIYIALLHNCTFDVDRNGFIKLCSFNSVMKFENLVSVIVRYCFHLHNFHSIMNKLISASSFLFIN